MKTFDAFISYRSDGGKQLAAGLKKVLEQDYGISSFYDKESLHTGNYSWQLVWSNLCSRVLVVVLCPNALDRCKNKGDWVYKEILLAMLAGKQIIPVKFKDFTFPEKLRWPLQKLKKLPCLDYDGQAPQEIAARVVAILRKGWFTEPDPEAFAQQLSKSPYTDRSLLPRIRASKGVQYLYQNGLISEDEQRWLERNWVSYMSRNMAPQEDVYAEQLCAILRRYRVEMVCRPNKIERDYIARGYGDSIENADKDWFCILKHRAEKWKRVLHPLIFFVLLVLICIPLYENRLASVLAVALLSPILAFGYPPKDPDDRSMPYPLLVRFLKGLLPSVLGCGVPYLLGSIVDGFLPDQYHTLVEKIILVWFVGYGAVSVQMVIYRFFSALLEAMNTLSWHMSCIWRYEVLMERRKPTIRFVQWTVLILLTIAAIVAVLLLYGGSLK